MKKLNQKKIRWIVKEVRKRELSIYQLAKQQGISKQHLWRVFYKYKDDNRPRLLLCGRKPKHIAIEEVELVKRIKEETNFGAVNIEKVLADRGVKMPHNRIHRILRQEGLAQQQPSKSRRRKWVRYERKHSNSLWHTDWFEMEDGKQAILYEDDASRLITGFGVFSNATTETALKVFDSAVARWGAPKQLMSDHGSQFCSNEERTFVFTEHLKAKGVEHILARVKHPQSNGKLERLVLTMRGLIKFKGCIEEAVRFYNENRPHMSLENGHLRTPLQAFHEKKVNN